VQKTTEVSVGATDSRHVTLDDVRKMIAAGESVKVIDDKSDEDITRSMLLQIISNQEQFGAPVLSTQLLEALICFYGNPIQEMLAQYLEQSIGNLLRQQQVMRTEMDGLVNNAGIVRDAMFVKAKDGEIIGKMTLPQWQAVIDVNLTGVFLCAREAAERMIPLKNAGVIINISSISRAGAVGFIFENDFFTGRCLEVDGGLRL